MGLSNGLSCENGSFYHHCNPHRFFQSEILRLLFPTAGTLGCGVCLTPQLFLLVYLHANVGLPALPATTSPSLPAAALLRVLSTWLPSSSPPTSLDEYFFFNSLVVGLPYSSIFWQFWLFFVLNLLLPFFWLRKKAQCIYLCLHLGQKSPTMFFTNQNHRLF